LFLFVVMMLDVNLERLRRGVWANLPLALAVGGVIVVEMITIITRGYLDSRPRPRRARATATPRSWGRLLYTDYAYPLELAAVRSCRDHRRDRAHAEESARTPSTRIRPGRSPCGAASAVRLVSDAGEKND